MIDLDMIEQQHSISQFSHSHNWLNLTSTKDYHETEAELLITELLKEHYSTIDIERLNNVQKAISFNETLLKKLKEY